MRSAVSSVVVDSMSPEGTAASTSQCSTRRRGTGSTDPCIAWGTASRTFQRDPATSATIAMRTRYPTAQARLCSASASSGSIQNG